MVKARLPLNAARRGAYALDASGAGAGAPAAVLAAACGRGAAAEGPVLGCEGGADAADVEGAAADLDAWV